MSDRETNKPYPQDRLLIRAAMEAARVEMEDDLHPINLHSQHLSDHYFGLGKVRTIRPSDENLLGKEDHEALDRMHSRLSLLLDLSGRRNESQNHLAAAGWHSRQALGKPNAAQKLKVKTERLLNVPQVKPSPFRKSLVQGEKAQGRFVDQRKQNGPPPRTVRIRKHSEEGRYLVNIDGPNALVNNVSKQNLQEAVRSLTNLGGTAHIIDETGEGLYKSFSSYEVKRYIEKTDSLGRRRCWRDGVPIKCPDRGGRKEEASADAGRDKVSSPPGGMQGGDALGLLRETLEALARMDEKELTLTFQRVGGSQDVSGPALEVSKQAVEEALFAPEASPEESPITDRPKGESKALNAGNRIRIGGTSPHSEVVARNAQPDERTIQILEDPEQADQIGQPGEQPRALGINRGWVVGVVPNENQREKALVQKTKANRYYPGPDERKLQAHAEEEEAWGQMHAPEDRPVQVRRDSDHQNLYRLVPPGGGIGAGVPVAREELRSRTHEMADTFGTGNIEDETGDLYKRLKAIGGGGVDDEGNFKLGGGKLTSDQRKQVRPESPNGEVVVTKLPSSRYRVRQHDTEGRILYREEVPTEVDFSSRWFGGAKIDDRTGEYDTSGRMKSLRLKYRRPVEEENPPPLSLIEKLPDGKLRFRDAQTGHVFDLDREGYDPVTNQLFRVVGGKAFKKGDRARNRMQLGSDKKRPAADIADEEVVVVKGEDPKTGEVIVRSPSRGRISANYEERNYPQNSHASNRLEKLPKEEKKE